MALAGTPCPECKAPLKDSFTETYCPNTDKNGKHIPPKVIRLEPITINIDPTKSPWTQWAGTVTIVQGSTMSPAAAYTNAVDDGSNLLCPVCPSKLLFNYPAKKATFCTSCKTTYAIPPNAKGTAAGTYNGPP